MYKQRKRKLGHWQVKALNDILNKRVCCHLRILDKVGGTASQWDRKYKRSLKRAIDAHNTLIATNSPIDPNFVIVLSPCGFELVNRDSFPNYASAF